MGPRGIAAATPRHLKVAPEMPIPVVGGPMAGAGRERVGKGRGGGRERSKSRARENWALLQKHAAPSSLK